jgi:hypothetical protein
VSSLCSVPLKPNRFATAAAGQPQNILYLLSVVADSLLNVQKRNFNFKVQEQRRKNTNRNCVQIKNKGD